MEKRATSNDVARAAGVSQSTVSFVLTGRAGISEATREKVLRAAAELNYRPNLAARSMRTRRTGRLAVVVPIASLNPLSLIPGAVAAAQEAGYAVEVVSLPHNPGERGERLAEIVGSGQYEGVLAFTPLHTPPLDADDPVVLSAGEFDDDMHAAGLFTDASPIVEMMERVAAMGHTRFLHIAGPQDFPSARARRQAYSDTVQRLGLTSIGVVDGDWSGQTGVDAIAALPDGILPLAVIAANDLIATGAIQAAMSRGWSVPGDVSITGWDDHPQSAFLVPPLTTVAQDRERLGAHAMARLIAALRGDDAPQRPADLLAIRWRESTGAPRA
ncbi:LacI family DNA-binding transcriptional regulator [Microbacterium arabinogalactanolyticum]|uniref:LacI family DNA-binding transcriptional regulator n=1 Tax=Microbacterium arabinogalactanolyticum TaxID=69365 RepID=UPI002552DB76|nr:LacI family DNA-binding transcriptional regulator [Microbacterium arabinogalactanolyticum]GLC85553.1 LacI family transcriptional regulator [Microbacterium arabinogalactanolyticum]